MNTTTISIVTGLIIAVLVGGYYFWLTTIDTNQKHIETMANLESLQKKLNELQNNPNSNPIDIQELKNTINEIKTQNNVGSKEIVQQYEFKTNVEVMKSQYNQNLQSFTDVSLDGPKHYLSLNESPFKTKEYSQYFYLIDFENQIIDTPGIKATNGNPIHFKTYSVPLGVDSVDSDDGYIDGVGRGGSYSYQYVPYGEFEFDQNVLNALPTRVGFVVTDADWNVTITVEAFGPDGLRLDKKFESVAVGDQVSQAGETDEDVFFGISSPDGIKKIKITMSGALEIDHVQYGR